MLIMLLPPDEATLKERLKGRGTETEEEIEKRLKRAEYELSRKLFYKYVYGGIVYHIFKLLIYALISKTNKSKQDKANAGNPNELTLRKGTMVIAVLPGISAQGR